MFNSRKRSVESIAILIIFLFGYLSNIQGASVQFRPEQQEPIREARIILPQKNNTGNPLDPIKEELEQILLDTFNGFTESVGMGGWESEAESNGTVSKIVHHEPVWIYDIAVVDNSETTDQLIDIATWIKEQANQDSVYLRLPNGEILFVL